MDGTIFHLHEPVWMSTKLHPEISEYVIVEED